MRKIALIIVSFFMMISMARGEENAAQKLADATISFFKPMTAEITAIEGARVTLASGEKNGVKPGMRMKLLREGAPFIHPVTREVLGRVESVVGKIEIKDVKPESSTGVVVEGTVEKGDKARISDTKIRMSFYQDKSIDWYLADECYRTLKGTGRIEMADSALETSDEAKLLEDAKKAATEVAVLVTAREADKKTLIRERLFWVSDGSKFFDIETDLGKEYAKDLQYGAELFSSNRGEAVLTYDLSFGARLVATGDIYGDGRKEILLATSRDVRVYTPAVDLQYLTEIKGPSSVENVWLDTIDLNKNGRDEVVIAALKNDDVVSSIYEYVENRFVLLWEGKYFIRKIGEGLIVQAYSPDTGFTGDIYELVWNGGYKLGEKVKVPKDVNIYDFVTLESMSGGRFIFAYDDKGFLNLYDDKGIRVWVSSNNTGGFPNTYKKRGTVSYLDPGVWAVKDRLVKVGREVLVVERIPVAEQARGVGYKGSRIRSYRWNGLSMEEGVLIDGLKGSLLDYSFSGETMAVLTSPLFGIKFGNILKGDNPLGTMLYVYSVKGR